MKYCIFICLIVFVFIDPTLANNDIQSGLLWSDNGKLAITFEWTDDANDASGVIKYVKDMLVWLLPLFAIGAFLYIWAKLFIARWNPEEFKNAMMHLVYVVIGIFFVMAAWAIIKLVAGIDL